MIRLLIIALLSGCAITDYTITDTYTPKGGGGWSRIPLDLSVKLRATADAYPEAVGMKKNGYGVDTAQVYTEPTARQWIEQALRAELTAQGFELGAANLWSSKENQAGRPQVEVRVEQLFVEVDVGFWQGELTAVAAANVYVTLSDGRRFRRKFVAEKSEKMMAWLDRDFERMLLEATQELLPAIGSSVRTLLEREKKDAS